MSRRNHKPFISFGARIRKSPYFDSTIKYGANAFTIYNSMYMPTAYAGNEAEYRSLVTDVTMWDVAAERQIEINGPDAYEFVRLLTPRNLAKCEIGDCKYILLTGEDGGIINDAVLLRLQPNQFWISPGDGDVLLWIQGVASNLGMDINIFEPDVSPLQIGGPKAPMLINKLFNGEHDDLRFYKARETSLEGIPMVIGRTGWSGEISYELYLKDGSLGNKLWELVREAGLEFNIVPIAPNSTRSIEGGLLSYQSDIRRKHSPYAVNLHRLVDLDQDINFIGKEALKIIKNEGTPIKLVGIHVRGKPIKSPPEHFWPIIIDEEVIGDVSRCIFSSRLNKNIGFASVNVEYSEPGTIITIKSPHGNLEAEVCEFPWIPAERIKRT
ncbi:MAG: glycine cleavage T C-terminal barrel domain-containing protein [Gammaproteobacteria bacterium]